MRRTNWVFLVREGEGQGECRSGVTMRRTNWVFLGREGEGQGECRSGVTIRRTNWVFRGRRGDRQGECRSGVTIRRTKSVLSAEGMGREGTEEYKYLWDEGGRGETLVSSRILTPCQPDRVTSGRITHSNGFFYTSSKHRSLNHKFV